MWWRQSKLKSNGCLAEQERGQRESDLTAVIGVCPSPAPPAARGNEGGGERALLTTGPTAPRLPLEQSKGFAQSMLGDAAWAVPVKGNLIVGIIMWE
ncbi:hypothetical protein SKAU_G00204190 [Synaphobranchus kaupii]|uniref:Uncharacterized protein n=1 Tax=Synaphobranchus kaupii TaxID=118154 RepID=A0A9Q1IYN7_SYNKA|nr:hypothetical protein SKAU_G00204190 [Synaphobranchus kaupii]